MPGHRQANLLGGDRAQAGFDSDNAAGSVLGKAAHLAVLDDVDPKGVGGAGVAPGNGVVSRRAGAPVDVAAQDRQAGRWRDIERRNPAFDLRRGQHLAIDAVEAHGAQPAAHALQFVAAVGGGDDAALAVHDVVVELPREALVEPDREVVDAGAGRIVVVGADNGGVAPSVAASQPAALQHGDITRSVVPGQVIGRRQAVAAGADDDHVVALLRRRRPPGGRPALLAPQAFDEEPQSGVALHLQECPIRRCIPVSWRGESASRTQEDRLWPYARSPLPDLGPTAGFDPRRSLAKTRPIRFGN